MPGLSSTVTFLSTDIEGSTELLQRLGDSQYAEVLGEHWRLLRGAIQKGNGREVSSQGDGVFVEFGNAVDAVKAAVAAQLAIATRPWPDGVVVRVRMGLHSGDRVDSAGDPVGLNVNRAARICEAGHGGQVLISGTTWSLVENDLPKEVGARDLGPHRLKDLKQPERIFQLLHPQLPAEFPPLRSLSARPNNLPIQLTSFIGREQEMAEIIRLLPITRLLTLIGAGGCGKTRLALHAAAGLLGRFEDGVWFVDLSALSDPALVPQAVTSVLGVAEQRDRTSTEALVSVLRSKSILIVLDNCEHLVVGCAHLTEALLRSCPGLRILATSRELLKIGGEVVFRVPSLSLPDPDATMSTERLMQYEAVQLFVDRARIAHPGFELTSRNGAGVARICRRLDGIPLAIELAAARVAVLSLEQIAERLNDRFRLLTGGSRTALPRHKTLRGAMEWSYDLLLEKEQMLLRRLSVFAGGWTLDAAEVVCGYDGIDRQEVLNVLSHLVDKSLVFVDTRDSGLRYRLLETVRQYSRELLMASGESPAVCRRHLEWFVMLAEQAEPQLLGPSQAVWFDRLELEHDNLRAALEWSENGAASAGLQLAGAVGRFWEVRGHLAEGRRWLRDILKASPAAPTAERARALKAAGNLSLGQGDYESARASYEEGLVIWQQLGNQKAIATLLSNLGFAAYCQGDDVSGDAFYRESLTIRREVGDTWGMALSLNNMGSVAIRRGDCAEANVLLKESLDLWQELGDKHHIAMVLTNLGLAACGQGDYDLAYSFLNDGLVIQRDVGDNLGIPNSLEGFASLAVALKYARRAARLLGAAEALRERIGAPLPYTERAGYDRIVANVRTQLGDDAFSDAWAEGRSIAKDGVITDALEGR
jgi:predicted ATPase/class 3 adenylate cyclase